MANGPEGTGDRSTHGISAQAIYVPYIHTHPHRWSYLLSKIVSLSVPAVPNITGSICSGDLYICIFYSDHITSLFLHTLLSNTLMKW